MLISAISALIKNPVKESFYGKKKTINILTVFFIFHKSDVKTFKWGTWFKSFLILYWFFQDVGQIVQI